jgi:hypothetical protein
VAARFIPGGYADGDVSGDCICTSPSSEVDAWLLLELDEIMLDPEWNDEEKAEDASEEVPEAEADADANGWVLLAEFEREAR